MYECYLTYVSIDPERPTVLMTRAYRLHFASEDAFELWLLSANAIENERLVAKYSQEPPLS